MTCVRKISVCLTGKMLKKKKKRKKEKKMTSWSFTMPPNYVYLAGNNGSPYRVDVGLARLPYLFVL